MDIIRKSIANIQTFSKYMYIHLHGADKNRGELLDGVQALSEGDGMRGVCQLIGTRGYFAGGLGQRRRYVPEKLDQVRHGVDHFRHSQILQHLDRELTVLLVFTLYYTIRILQCWVRFKEC